MCMIRSDNKLAIPIADRQSRVGNVTLQIGGDMGKMTVSTQCNL